MEFNICESLVSGGKKVVCRFCARQVSTFDRLTDGTAACLSCSYEYELKQTVDCVFHTLQFDPSDPELRVEMIRIAQVDIDKADKSVCETSMIIPEVLFEPLKKLQHMHNSSLNAEIVSALGWYTTMCLSRHSSIKNTSLDPAGIHSIESEIPEDLVAVES